MVFRRCSVGGRIYQGDLVGDGEEEDENSPTRFTDSVLLKDLEDAISDNPDPEVATHARLLNGFFTVLALCHTVLTSVDPKTGEMVYKAQSPDEAALVQAAADVGFVFCGRDKEILSLRTPSTTPDVEKYELLNILEFNSARKRMSVVVRGEEGRLFLLTKGADNVIFERLRSSEEQLKVETEIHLNEFANEGLRTLTLAYKIIGGECWCDDGVLIITASRFSEDEYRAWNERYHAATISIDDREAKIQTICNELEQNLRLLGATAIEDRLQEGVPETIFDLKRAGIKIWVATGDKMETAIGIVFMHVTPQYLLIEIMLAIGRSTNLIGTDANIIHLCGSGKGRPVDEQMAHAVKKFFPDSGIVAEDLPRPSSRNDGHRDIPLQRIDTGISSIVGTENGDRPGGFVLVADGAALLQVSSYTSANVDLVPITGVFHTGL